MDQTNWDVIIIGAGPAGLMTAITCAEKPLRILILEGNSRPGAKLLISGGGRCNITNLRVSERDYQSGDPRTVRNILSAFSSERAVQFFKTLGVPMVLEEGTKYFPESQSAKTVLEALLKEVRARGVILKTGKKTARIFRKDELLHVTGESFDHASRAVVLCTGGLSYPGTGSDGSGYGLAKMMGHSMAETRPALTPLLTDDPDWKELSGITLPVRLTLFAGEKPVATSEGPLLFTHTGFSGPAVLDISGPWLRCAEGEKELQADFFPEKNGEELRGEWARIMAAHPKRSWRHLLSLYFPERLILTMLKKIAIDPKTQIGQSSQKDREVLLRILKHFPLLVTGACGYEKAEVTSGGVDLREVDGKTLESKLQPGLYFAGEILDVDGRIGGFNFQWAWASGFVVGQAIKHCVTPKASLRV
ncbi:MAG: NAD(P)/FAD-dependent oxidoreductase [Candidatus Omnitrophica bacterium]|nr:NAD(P)/FAD-dependent oxidoreductase [Candidatus Omnitrophota bacterium]